MAESWSVEAMKIVIDSETEKFSAGITAAKGMVESFSSVAGRELPKVDAAIVKVGDAVDAVKSKLGIWLQLAETVLGMAGKVKDSLNTGATLAGFGAEAEQVTKSVEGVASGIMSGLSGLVASTKQEIGQATLGMMGFKAAVAESSEEQERAVRVGDSLSDGIDSLALGISRFHIASYDVEGVTKAFDDLAHSAKRLGDKSAFTLEDWNREIAFTTSALEKLALQREQLTKEIGAGAATNLPAIDVWWYDAEEISKGVAKLAGQMGRYQDALKMAVEQQIKLSEVQPTDADKAVDKQVEALNKQTLALADQAATWGMTRQEADEYLTVLKALQAVEAAGVDIEDKHREKITEAAAALRHAKEEAAAYAKEQEAQKSSESFTEKLTREIEALKARTAALSMSGPAAAAYLAEQKALAEATQRHFSLSEKQRALLADKTAAEENLKIAEADKKKAEGDEKAVEAAIQGMEKQIAALQQKTRALLDNSVAGNAAATTERVLADLHAKNVEVTEADIAAIEAWARAQAEATRTFEDNQKQLANFKSAAQAVTSELDSAFKAWTNGSALDVKKMVQSMLSDLAMLTFKKNVTDNLSSLMSSGLSSVFQMREAGGPVEAGVPYVVGEKRPELFVPDQSGYILPQVPQASSSSTTVTHMPLSLTIDARGATPDAVRALELRIPTLVLDVMTEARDRGIAA